MGQLISMQDFRSSQPQDDGQIVIGQRVYSQLHGGRSGIVYAIHGQQSPESVKTLGGGAVCYGGSAEFDIVYDNGTKSRRLPESILHGVQWEIFNEVVAPQEIEAALASVDEEEKKRRAEKLEAARLRELAKSALVDEYTYLKPSPGSGGVGASKNVRIELKRAFPGIKFSVRSSYDSINISWEDGPVGQVVDDLVSKYQSGHFNGMEDIYEYNESAFNEVFGGCRYVFTNRNFSDAGVQAGIDSTWQRWAPNTDEVAKPEVAAFRSGSLYNAYLPHLYDDVQKMIWQTLTEINF